MGEPNRPMTGVPNSAWNEPQIFSFPPEWTHMEELSRTKSGVWFKTRTGRKLVPLKYVEEWEARQNDGE